jgi:prepilin-type N-terminal cleavage/methylation domain-containing protein
MKNQQGMSIIELLVTVAVIGILCRIMTLSFVDFRESFSQNNSRFQLDADLRRLRNEAVAAGGRGVLTVSPDGTSYSLGLDYAPFATTAAPDRVIFTRKLPRNITLVTSRTILFDTRGYVSTEGGATTTVVVILKHFTNSYFSATLYSTGALS